MIIWSGLGILVIPIVALFFIISMVITGKVSADPDYFELHGWPMALSFLASAIACWFVGKKLKESGSRTLLDPQTGQPVVLRRRHSLFFIPVQWWGLVLIVVSLMTMSINKTPEELREENEQRAVRQAERAAAKQLKRAAAAPSSESKP